MIAITQKNSCDNEQSIPMSEALDLQPLLQEKRSLRWERNLYKSLLDRARAREQLLKQEVQQLNARIRYLEKRLYGRNSEKKTSKSKSNSSTASSSDGQPKRSRGHQPANPGHGRRDYSHLPVQEEIYELDEAVCAHCECFCFSARHERSETTTTCFPSDRVTAKWTISPAGFSPPPSQLTASMASTFVPGERCGFASKR